MSALPVCGRGDVCARRLQRRPLYWFTTLALASIGIPAFAGHADPSSLPPQDTYPTAAIRSAVTLEPVVVTAPMQTSPLRVVLDPKRPYQPVPASDGADFLKSIPGFDTIRKGGSNGDPVFRGMVGSRLNILVDGGQTGGGCPSRMDPPTAYIAPELFDKVTLVKGPETVIWGPGNSAGTVLFDRTFTRYEKPSWSFMGSLLGGTRGRFDQTADIRAGTPDFYMGVSANHTHADDYEDGSGHRVHSSYERWNTDVTLGWTPGKDTRVELTAGRGNGHAAYAFSGMDGVQFLRQSLGLHFVQENLSETFTKLDVRAYYNSVDHVMDNYTLRRPDPDSAMPMAMASEPARQTRGGRVAGTFDWGDAVELVAGIDGSGNTHTSRSGGPEGSAMGYYRDKPRRRDATVSTVGGFGQLTWYLTTHQRLIGGARVDWAHVRGYALAVDGDSGTSSMADGMGMGNGAPEMAVASRSATLPSGFLRYEHDLTGTHATLYAGIGHVERFPDYWEMFGGHVASTVTSFQSLRPERTTQLDAGVQYQTRRTQAWVSAYAGVVNDYILIHYLDGNGNASNVNARIMGGEAGMVHAFGNRWKGNASVAYAWGKNQTEHHPLPQLPPLDVKLGLVYDAGRWSTGVLWRVDSAQHRIAIGEGNIVGDDLGPTGGFGVFSVNGSMRLSQEFTLSAGVDNLFNKTYAESVNAISKELQGYAGATRINEPGRTFWAKLEVKL